MTFSVGDVVMSINGRDSKGLFYIISMDEQYAWIADGKGRRFEKPKKKKLKHLQFVTNGDAVVAEKLKCGDKATNNELRRSLNTLVSADCEEQGGM